MHTLTYTTPDGATHTRRTSADYRYVSVCRNREGGYVVTGWHTKPPSTPKNEGGYLSPVGVFPLADHPERPGASDHRAIRTCLCGKTVTHEAARRVAFCPRNCE